MKTIKRTRIELFIPFIRGGVSKEVLNDLIQIAGVFFKGCTVIDNVIGYYRSDEPLASTKDRITILIFDVKYTIKKDGKYIKKLIKTFSDFINNQFGEDVIYYSYYSVNSPNF
ncbi:MAG: hypothetical protein IPM14_02005 [bacterium]|nr:hypothetical protein [bacterium]